MRPLSKPAFRVQISSSNLGNKSNPVVKLQIEQSIKTGMIRYKPTMPDDPLQFQNWTPLVAEVDEAYSTIEPLYPDLLMFFLSKGRDVWHQQFATEAYRKEMEMQIDVSRDALRDFDFPTIADPGLAPTATPLAATQQILANGPGMVIGNDHGDKAPHDLLHAALDSGDIGLVFIEELDVLWQPMVDEFLDSPIDEFPPLLEKKLKALQDTFKLDFAALLRKTKQKGARLYGIDAAEAHYYEASDPRHHEDRNASMNRVSDEVIKGAMRKHPNKKFVAVCGEAHANTSPGGIPGIAQLLNAPAVKFNPAGKLQFEAEDTSNRAMPPKEVQAFVDQFSLKLMKEYKEFKDKDGTVENLDSDDLHAVAVRLAQQLQQGNRLNSVKDVAKALNRPEVQQAYQQQFDLTKARAAKREEMRQAIDSGDVGKLDTLLTKFQQDDPFGSAHEVTLARNKSTLLHYAAEKGQPACIDKLLAKGYNVHALDDGGRTSLQMAVAGGSLPTVQKLIGLGADPNLGTGKGAPPALWNAARSKDPSIVGALLRSGANPNVKVANDDGDGYKDTDGRSALHMAIATGDLGRAQELIAGGADLNQLDGKGKTPLQLVVEKGLTAWIQPLVAGGANPNLPNSQGQTALHLAAAEGSLVALTTLQANGANLEALDAEGNTPLLVACAKGQEATARRLLLLNANALVQNGKGEQALHLAAETGLNAVVSELLDNRLAVLTSVDGQGNTAIHRACQGVNAKKSGVSDNLLQRAVLGNVSLDAKNAQGATALHLAAVRGDDALATDLTHHGASTTETDASGLTALERALAEHFRAETTKAYLQTKADKGPELLDRELTEVGIALAQALVQTGDFTQLSQLAAMAVNVDFVGERDALIKRTQERAQTFQKAKDAMSANKLTEAKGLDDLLQADPALLYYQDADKGRGLLHYAALMRKSDAVTQLARAGADVNRPDLEGNTPLHAACMVRKDVAGEKLEQAKAVKALLAAPHLDPNVQNDKGWTPSHFAAWNGNEQSLAELFDSTNPVVDVNITDERGWTPYDVVVGSTKTDAEAMFYAKGKAPQTPLFATPGQHSTVDILVKATKCENPAHVQLVKDSYEAMYADSTLRPILDLVALDACAKREPPDFGKGLRIYIADDANNGQLWNAAGADKTGARGAIDEKANVMQVSAKKSLAAGSKVVKWDAQRNDFSGCLIHEMTHCATRIVYGDKDNLDPTQRFKCEPFNDTVTKGKYLTAIQKTVAESNLLCNANPVEAEIRDRVSGRMGHYVQKTHPEHELLMEHIVSVPQLIAQFGEANVKDQIKDLKSFFDDFSQQCVNKAQSNDFASERAFVDTAKNKQLETSLLVTWPLSTKKEAVVKPGKGDEGAAALSLDTVMTKIEQQLRIELGTLDTSKTTIAYDANQFVITDVNKRKLVEDRCLLIRRGLAKTFTDGQLPEHLLTKDFRGLIADAVALTRSTTPTKQLEAEMNTKAGGWLRNAKINYVQNAVKEQVFVDSKELAEAIILKAEKDAQGGTSDVIDFKSKKHLAAIEQLANDLDSIPFDKQFDQAAIFNDVTGALVTGDRSGGFYKKKPARFGKAKPNYVSIKVSYAKREWLNALANL